MRSGPMSPTTTCPPAARCDPDGRGIAFQGDQHHRRHRRPITKAEAVRVVGVEQHGVTRDMEQDPQAVLVVIGRKQGGDRTAVEAQAFLGDGLAGHLQNRAVDLGMRQGIEGRMRPDHAAVLELDPVDIKASMGRKTGRAARLFQERPQGLAQVSDRVGVPEDGGDRDAARGTGRKEIVEDRAGHGSWRVVRDVRPQSRRAVDLADGTADLPIRAADVGGQVIDAGDVETDRRRRPNGPCPGCPRERDR